MACGSMPVVVNSDMKLPLGVHRVQVHRVQANIPHRSMAK